MIPSNISTQSEVMVPDEVSRRASSSILKPRRQKVGSLHRMAWMWLFLACLGASWFSYQYFLVPQPKSFVPDWHSAQWVQAADGNAPVAYFRHTIGLEAVPDGSFVTVAANQVFRLYVNGFLIGGNNQDVDQGIFPRAYMYDVVSLLKPGPNVIALWVANKDEQIPAVRVSLGIVQGKSVDYYGTDEGWQATAQSTAAYPRYATDLKVWTKNTFDASAWLPAQKVAHPPISPALTVNPLLYEQPVSTHWMSTGTGDEAYFVRQVSLPFGITGAWLRLVAVGTANVFINGHLFIVWNGQPPTPPQDQNLANYLTSNDTTAVVPYRTGLRSGVYDISPYLHPGGNTIAVHVPAPGVSASLVGLDSLNAAMSLDMLVSDSQGHNGWLPSGADWHASPRPVEGWEQGSSAALAWPFPVSVSRPGSSRTFYMPESSTLTKSTPYSEQLISLSLLFEVILISAGAVLGFWLLMSLFLMRRYYHSYSHALEAVSLAYLPAIACEAMLMVLSREPRISQPFPYTWFWGLVLIMLVGVGSILLVLNARTLQKQVHADISNSAKRSFFSASIAAFHGSFLTLPNTAPYRAWLGEGRVLSRLLDRVLAWLRLHWALVLLVLLAIPLISYNLSYEPYWQDELVSYYAAKGILAHGFPIRVASGFVYMKGELYSYLLALIIAIFGDQGGTPRTISAVEYLACLPLLYGVGCYFFGRRIALLATAMLMLSPLAFMWGRQVRMYQQAQLMTLLVVYLFYKALQERQRVHLVYLAVLCLLLAYFSHEEVFIIFPGLVLLVLVTRTGKTDRPFMVLRQKHWWYAAVIGGSIIAVHLLIVHVSHPPVLGTDESQRPFIQLHTDSLQYYLRLLFFPWTQDHVSLGAMPFIALNSLLATIGCIWAIRGTDMRAKYCAVFLCIASFTLVFVFTMQSDRYFYPLLPIYYLMGAYAMLVMLRAMWKFARPHCLPQHSGRTALPASGGHLSRPMRIVVTFILGLLCACVLILPMLPINNYNLFISRLAGLSYHRHKPDYDAAGQYLHQHWRKGDIVIAISQSISIQYYTGRSDAFFSVDRALYLFERNGSITDTPTGTTPILSQDDFQALLATHARVWIVSDGGQYQFNTKRNRRFVFPSDFHLVFEGYGSSLYLRGG